MRTVTRRVISGKTSCWVVWGRTLRTLFFRPRRPVSSGPDRRCVSFGLEVGPLTSVGVGGSDPGTNGTP